MVRIAKAVVELLEYIAAKLKLDSHDRAPAVPAGGGATVLLDGGARATTDELPPICRVLCTRVDALYLAFQGSLKNEVRSVLADRLADAKALGTSTAVHDEERLEAPPASWHPMSPGDSPPMPTTVARSPFNRPRWTVDDAPAVITAFHRSGKSVGAFSQDHGLDPQRVYLWRRRLGASALPVPFEEIHVAPGPIVHGVTAESPGFELVLASGHILRVPPTFDTAALRRLLDVLSAAGLR